MDVNELPMPLYTPEDLLLYLYKETSQLESAAIEAALAEDWTLREKFEVLQASVKSLDAIVESPRQEVVFNVLNYAQKAMIQPA